MARYTQESIERLREAVDIVGLVSRRTDLRRVGSRHVGLCPFHEERTPSFSVNPERNLYHCFGCGAGGDAIRFVMETEALGFPEALEQLAGDANVELERDREDPRDEERRRRHERLLALLDRAAAFYATYLWEATEAARARSYLAERGLSEEVLRAFRVGYAPKPWDRLLLGARRDGFSEQELLAADLARRGRSGGLYDRFRERIMFPLADARGRVLGFGARAMRDDQGAKYLNTAEGELYHKSRLLFGLDRARRPMAESSEAVVVEGYTDVLALHDAGIEQAVAIMGTALTSEHLEQLSRAVGKQGTVQLALDADGPGRDAMLRSARMAEQRGVGLRVVQMPEGSDPADLVAAGRAGELAERLRRSLRVVEFEVERVLADANLETAEGRDLALTEVRELIATTPAQSAQRDQLVRGAADRLEVAPHLVAPRSPPGADDAPRSDRTAAAGGEPAPSASGALEAERVFLALCMASGPAGREHLLRLEPAHFSSDLTRRARDHLVQGFDDPLAGLPSGDQAFDELVSGIAVAAESRSPDDERSLRMSFLALDLRRIERELKRARRERDFVRQRELATAKRLAFDEMDVVMGQAT